MIATTSNLSYLLINQYDWDTLFSFGNGNSTGRGDSVFPVTPVAGDYTYYVQISTSSGCQFIDSVDFRIGIPYTPVNVIGDSTLCIGDTIDLKPQPSGDVDNWSWVLPNGNTALGKDMKISPDSLDYLIGLWACVQAGDSICTDTTFVAISEDNINYDVLRPSSPQSVCYGRNLRIQADSFRNPNARVSSYEWLDACNNVLITGVDSLVRSTLTANETIYLRMTTDSLFRCTYVVDTFEIIVNNNPLPAQGERVSEA